MATTTKSTKKTPVKTVKSTTSKKLTNTKSPVASKVSKSGKTTEVIVKASAKKTQELSPLERLRSMHVTSAIVYLLFAGLVIAFVKTAAVAVLLPLQTRDQFASNDHVVLGGANEVLYNIEPKYMLVLSLVFGIIAAVLLATKLRNRYQATLTNRTSGFRWLATGLSSAAMLIYVYQIAGLTDAWTLKFGATMIMVTAVFAWIAERDNATSVKPKWLAYIVSLFTGAMAWLPVAGTFIGTALYGNERFGWEVYVIALVTVIGFSGFAINQYRQLRPAGRGKDYVYIEASYFQIDLFTKFAVVLLSLIALK